MKFRNLAEKSYVKIFLFTTMCAIWGSTWLTIKVGLQELPLLFSLGARFILASLVLLILMKIFKVTVPLTEKAIFLYLYLSLFAFLIPFSLVYWAELTIPSNLASILFSTMPIFAGILAKIFLKEELNAVQKLGLLLGFFGVALIFGVDLKFIPGKKFLAGMFAVIVSAFLNATVLIMVKKYGMNIHPLAINFIPLGLSGLILLVLSFIFENFDSATFGIRGIASVIYLGVFGSVVTFTIYYWLLKKVPATIMSLSAFVTPLFAVSIGIFIGREILGKYTLIGGLLVLLGVLFVNSAGLLKNILHRK